MNQTKFTPGPWDIFPNYTTKRACIGKHIPHNNLVMEVAEVAFNDSEWQANARLIAKAPEMFEALKALFDNCAMIHKQWGENCNRKEACEAIERAQALLNSIHNGGGKRKLNPQSGVTTPRKKKK